MRPAPLARIVLALLPALLAVQCRAPSGTQVLRAELAGDDELFPSQVAINLPLESAALNDAARFLAGLPAVSGRDAFASLRESASWKNHREDLDSLWSDFESRLGIPASSWARTEISDLRSASAVFYPFSGPDFLFAHLFYPRADTYLLCGLEACEPLPAWDTLTEADIAAGLEGLHHAQKSLLQFSYFITKDMRRDLQATRFRGVLPLFLVFLARTGHAVESVEAVRLDGAGNPIAFPAGQSTVPGLLIRARGPGGSKRIYYFSQDLSNGTQSPNSPLLRFAAGLGRPAALIKSASYLLHEPSFSSLRQHLLTRTCGVVQDPSGIPFRIIREQGLQLSLHGNYEGTIDVFRNHEQADLIAAYADPAYQARPLTFGVGYLLQPKSTSLMVIRPR